MKRATVDLQEKLESLKQIHYKALHELADAVQIIKSYEFLQRVYEDENKRLRTVCELVEDLCNSDDFKNTTNINELKKVILEYKMAKNFRFDSDFDKIYNFKSFWSKNGKRQQLA